MYDGRVLLSVQPFHNEKKQLILTCDVLPAKIEGMDDRLKSRFSWGMYFYHPQYLRGLRDLCDEFDIVLIFDEIASAWFGDY